MGELSCGDAGRALRNLRFDAGWRLLWYKQNGYETGERSWTGPRQVGSGWGDFKQIIPMGDGIVYALRQDGKLIWYKHIGYETGERSWSEPREVGSGWDSFQLCSPVVVVSCMPSRLTACSGGIETRVT